MKIDRKKFFASLGLGLTGLFVFKSGTIKQVLTNTTNSKLCAKPNPLAIKREKTRVNNG